MTPRLHTSTSGPSYFFPWKSSGAAYGGEPQKVSSLLPTLYWSHVVLGVGTREDPRIYCSGDSSMTDAATTSHTRGDQDHNVTDTPRSSRLAPAVAEQRHLLPHAVIFKKIRWSGKSSSIKPML
ncbi:hypothetical protein EYF80_038251 [Liparis tanakae]|uniref:Uncharacterized protein n=1 Tax=Liparis tanakae TaxID=230148 RepID=A0A4Z2GFX5_9TELE|nr:hypothetical protein EYF80_038251 [Liparis tanakae]